MYNQEKSDVKNLLSASEGSAANGNLFLDYFLTNWDQCTEMWVDFHRARLPHFRNNTNNRLERAFGKIKRDIPPTSRLHESLRALLRYEEKL